MVGSRRKVNRLVPPLWQRVTTGVTLITLMALGDPAWAYRPFDGTDAAVAEPGEVEIEFQPAGVLRTDEQKNLIRGLRPTEGPNDHVATAT